MDVYADWADLPLDVALILKHEEVLPLQGLQKRMYRVFCGTVYGSSSNIVRCFEEGKSYWDSSVPKYSWL